ncbi:LysR family transcriptional regulator [Roseibium marinum]|uniref:LysR family transcriptional regulator n=1 Tax=Roseibium marinum TaxID=281252 RepID=UPI001474A652|nr:LysR family transcriptional regulator [Roseibium marinum]
MIYFQKALETGNITQAAAELHVAQTALGIQIRNLESELGVPLLERHSRGVRATPCGDVLSQYAEEIISRVEQAKRAVRERAGSGTKTITLGLTPSIVRLVGDEILTDLSHMLPGVSLAVVEDFSIVLMRQLERGELSCALTFAQHTDPRFTRRALLEEELFLITANETDGDTGEITFRDAIAHELALCAERDVVTMSVTEIATRLGVPLQVAYQVQSLRAVKNLVAKGVAATIMPYGAAEGELRKGEFIARHIVSPAIVRTLAIVIPRDRGAAGLGPEFDAFIDAVADRLHAARGPVTRRL